MGLTSPSNIPFLLGLTSPVRPLLISSVRKDPGHPFIWNDAVVHSPPGSLSEWLLQLIIGCHSWASDLTWAPLMQKDRRHPHRLKEILIPSSAHNIREQTPRLMADSFCLHLPVLKVTRTDLEKYWGIIYLQQPRLLFNRSLRINCNMLPNTQTSRVTDSQASTFHVVTSTFWFLQIDNMHGKKVQVIVAQSCPTLGNPMDCSLQGSSVHGILQARILEWVAICSSRGSSWPRDWTQVSHIAGRFFTVSTTRQSQMNTESSQPRDWTHVSHVFCAGRKVLYHYCHLGSPICIECLLKSRYWQAPCMHYHIDFPHYEMAHFSCLTEEEMGT